MKHYGHAATVGLNSIFKLPAVTCGSDSQHQTVRSKVRAMPCPPPMQSVTKPRLTPLRSIACRSRVVKTAPVAPIG